LAAEGGREELVERGRELRREEELEERREEEPAHRQLERILQGHLQGDMDPLLLTQLLE
jgi:hypothetical protein